MRDVPFADAHLHPTAEGFGEDYPDLRGAELVFGCAARRGEWDALKGCGLPGLVRFYGVHPWYVEDWSPDAEDQLHSILERETRAHVGEIGLDAKRGSLPEQVPAFEAQLDIASEYGRIANVHMVGCEKEVLESVRRHGKGCHTVIIHSFSSESYAKPFSELGCMLSLNPRVLARSDARLERLVSSIPEGSLLLETDAPYAPRGFCGMHKFAEELCARTGADPEHMIATALGNARRITDV